MKKGTAFFTSDTTFGLHSEALYPRGRQACHKLLLIDDNIDAADMLACVLEAKGYIDFTTYDGRSGIAAAASYQPDVILLDIGMPGMNGFDVVKALRKMEQCTDVLICAHSGYGLETDKQRSREAGFDAHLTKPLAFDEFDLLIRSHFDLTE